MLLGRTKNNKKSLATQKAEESMAKAKSELTVKIRRADKNLKLLFSEFKKILNKPNDDVIFPTSDVKVENAKLAEKRGKFVTCIYEALTSESSRQVPRTKFIQFVKNFLK